MVFFFAQKKITAALTTVIYTKQIPKRKGYTSLYQTNKKKERGIFMFEEKSLFEIEPEEAKLECQWCGEEVPEDELYHGVCLTCIENYYEPELARQFLEDAGLEAYFYVMDYMRTDYNTIDIRVIDACKKEFWEKLSIAKFNAVNFPALYSYDEKSVWELQCLKEYVLSDDVFYDWADWVIDYDETREKVAAAAKAGNVVVIAPAKQDVR